MTQPEDSRTFKTEIHLAASRDAVWEAIATDEGLRRWFAPEARFERRVGGEVVWNWADHHRWVQRIEALEPGRRLRTRYDSPVDDGAGGKRPLFIEFLLEGEGGTTTLRVVQSGFGSEAAFDNEYDGIRQGWPVELRSLRLYLERHRGKARQLAWCTRVLEGGAGSDPGAIWDRLMGARGFRCDAPVETLAEGTPLDFTSVDGDRFAGVALRCNARELTADLESHGGAFLRLTVGVWGGRIHVWCWLGAYGRDPRELAALEERWDAMLTRLFGVQSPSQDRVGAGA